MTWRQELDRLRKLLLRHHRQIRRDAGAGAAGVQWVEIAAGSLGDALKDLPPDVLRRLAPADPAMSTPEQVGAIAAKMHLNGQAMGHAREQRAADVVEGPQIPLAVPKAMKLGMIPEKRTRHCRFCGSADHDARGCDTPTCGDPADAASCMVVRCRFHANVARAPAGTQAEAPAPAETPSSDDEDPEPADFVYPKSETLLAQRRENLRGRVLSVAEPRPKIVGGACTNDVRPCPWQGCKHHLAIWDVSAVGSIRYSHPGKTLETMAETCVLDVVRDNPDGATLEVVGAMVGLTRERVRQIEEMATAKGEETVPASAA